MIQMRCGSSEICRRRHPGERPEVVDERGLAIVAAVQRDVSAIDLFCSVNRGESLLEAPHAAEGFRREAYLLAKKLDEASRADSNLLGHPRNRPHTWCAAKMMQRIVNGRMPCKRPCKLFEQVLLKDSKHIRHA